MIDAVQIVPVSSNVTWANVPVLALYCTHYKALFGSVNLQQMMSMKTSGMQCCPTNVGHAICLAVAL